MTEHLNPLSGIDATAPAFTMCGTEILGPATHSKEDRR